LVYIDQVETADVVVLNKADCVSETEMAELKEMVTALNKDAELITATFGNVPVGVVLPSETSARESRALARHAVSVGAKRARQEESGAAEPRYKTRFRVRNVVFRKHNTKPFHPQRFHALLNSVAAFMGLATTTEEAKRGTRFGALRGVLRAKGLVWIADAPAMAVRLACAGSRVELHAHEEWGKGGAGNPRHELVVIGQELEGEAVTALLENALLTDSEYAEFQADPEGFGKKAAQRSEYWCNNHKH